VCSSDLRIRRDQPFVTVDLNQVVRDALDRAGGNRTRAAEALGITRQGLLKKLKRYAMLP